MFSILYNIIIAPIELVVEIVFEMLYRLIGQHEKNQGIAIIGVSLVISLLTLPLYHRADKVQQEQRNIQSKLLFWINHIKKAFKGDERFMMLQTYYKINNYNTFYSLKGSSSLLLEIPFFMAAYHFLSNLTVLNGASFGIIKDLGKPDSLLHLGSFSINILPIAMTIINCISASIYLKGFPLKEKIQTYGMALIFLILLYNSPSGLVVYWTCNNIFSLGKNIFYKLKDPKKAAILLTAASGFIITVLLILSNILNSKKKVFFVFIFQYITFLPLLFHLAKNSFDIKKFYLLLKFSKNKIYAFDSVTYILQGLFFVVFIGILIPSSVIKSSPAEFVDLNNYKSPLLFLKNSICYSAGFFLLWITIIRQILPKENRKYIDIVLWLFSGVFVLNYMCFGHNLGVLSPTLLYENGLSFSGKIKLLNLFLCVALIAVLYFIVKYKNFVKFTFAVLLICSSMLAAGNIYNTRKQLSDMAYLKDLKKNKNTLEPIITLNKNGKNVIVFMLDRAISGYIPYIFEEKPELKEQFSGFTYYPNTISHGFYTNFGVPGLFGGYEYTPTEMNKRDKELLVLKHNEALKVLPVIFSSNNYEVTICDPPYANYSWVPDLSIFEDYPQFKKFVASGVITNEALLENAGKESLKQNERNFFCYSIFKVMPLCFAKILYDDGKYYSSKEFNIENETFYKEFSVLSQLPELTDFSDSNKNTYLAMNNASTHEYCELQLPNYELKSKVDNTGFKTAADGKIAMEEKLQYEHYHINAASLLAFGKWLDYLKENGVYDNTRIILVSDHGRGLAQFQNMLMKKPEIDVEWCNALLMFKDFNSSDLITSNEFMTTADVPTLATKDIIEKPVNPFTGKQLNNEEKNSHPQIITTSHHWDTTKYKGTTFETSDGEWLSVHDDIFEEANWNIVE